MGSRAAISVFRLPSYRTRANSASSVLNMSSPYSSYSGRRISQSDWLTKSYFAISRSRIGLNP